MREKALKKMRRKKCTNFFKDCSSGLLAKYINFISTLNKQNLGERRRWINREIGIDIYTLPWVREQASGKLLCSFPRSSELTLGLCG